MLYENMYSFIHIQCIFLYNSQLMCTVQVIPRSSSSQPETKKGATM